MNREIAFSDTAVAFSYKSDEDLKKSFLLFASINNNLLVKLGTNMVKFAFKLKVPIKGIIKKTVFSQFCGGESIQDCEKTINTLAKYNVRAILDYAAEGEKSESVFDQTAREVIRTIEKAAGNPNIPFSVFKPTGLAAFDVLAKLHVGEALNNEEKQRYENAKRRFFEVGKKAFDKNVRLFIDSEETWIQNPIDDLVYEMMAEFNKEKVIVHNTYQMYRKNMLGNLQKAIEKGRDKGYKVGAKLVRGAYMEKERERAAEKGYEDPIMPNKDATDQQYDHALKLCVENIDIISVCNGSHNENSNLYLTKLMSENDIRPDDERVYFAQLFGMSDNISFNLAKAGYNVVKYVPYGPIKTVMPYLFRRAEENTSIAGQSSRELQFVKKELSRRKKENRK
ncbi:MAG TPA: proline dehydrogenase [Cytophagales bacterium]|jgi:proline dehydrogenase|nr:proline dehydrogenase [Cytophagales bacterium]